MKLELRLACILLGTFAVILVGSVNVEAEVTVSKIAPGWSGCSVAADAVNLPHIAYQSRDLKLWYARFNGRTWHHELVDSGPNCGFGASIVVDPSGGVHIAYSRGEANRELAYAYFDGTQWQVSSVGVEAWFNIHLKVDAAYQPHVMYCDLRSQGYAKKVGGDWQVEDLGLDGCRIDGLALDQDGFAHACYNSSAGGSQNVCYLTNKSGSWQSTVLHTGRYALSTIALDGAGFPHVVMAPSWPPAIEYYSFDGTIWSNETVLTIPTPNDNAESRVDAVSLVLDRNDRPHLLFTRTHFIGLRQYGYCEYAFNNGFSWSTMVVDRKDAGEVLSAAMSLDGTLYGTYLTGKEGQRTVTCVRATLPELSGVWRDVSLTGTATDTTFSGFMSVSNDGPAKSTNTFAALYLSEDAELDAKDTLLPARIPIKALKPLTAALLKVRFRNAGSLAGKYLIAVIDPNRTTADSNRLNNTAAVLLGQTSNVSP